MRSDVEMQDPAPSMLDHKETIQELKTPRGHCKEIHSDDHFAMIGEEGEPASGGIAAAPRMSQIPGHGALRDPEADLQELAMDLRSAPGRIFHCQPTNQVSDLLAHFWSAAGWARSPFPRTGGSLLSLLMSRYIRGPMRCGEKSLDLRGNLVVSGCSRAELRERCHSRP